MFYDMSIRQIKKIMYYLRKTIFVSCKILQRHNKQFKSVMADRKLTHCLKSEETIINASN